MYSFQLSFFLFSICRDSEVSDCGKYLIVSIYEELRQNLLYIADLANGEIVGKLPLIPIISQFNADYEVSSELSYFSEAESQKFISHDDYSMLRTQKQKWSFERIGMRPTSAWLLSIWRIQLKTIGVHSLR